MEKAPITMLGGLKAPPWEAELVEVLDPLVPSNKNHTQTKLKAENPAKNNYFSINIVPVF